MSVARLHTAFYYENFINLPMFGVEKQADGTYVANWPFLMSDGPIGSFSVAETGAYVLEALKKPEEWIGNATRLCC